jgi:hypothetical protein
LPFRVFPCLPLPRLPLPSLALSFLPSVDSPCLSLP